METPKFTIKKYFETNYGLGYRPKVSKLNLNKYGVIATIVFLILAFAVNFALILVAIAVGFIFIGLPVMKNMKEKKVQQEWDEKFDYCRSNWYKEYENTLKKTIKDLKLDNEKRGMEKLGVVKEFNQETGEEYWQVAPFYISGKDYNGYYRVSADGKSYRTDGHEITWLYFDKHQIYIYNVKFKLTEPTKIIENEQSFVYKDITTIATGTTSILLKASNNAEQDKNAKDSTIDTEVFTLSVYGEKFSYSFTTNESVHKSINGMKNLIRQKKLEK